MAFPRSSYGVHGDITAFPPRLYGATMAFSRHVNYLTAILWQGVVTALMALARSVYRVQWRFMIKHKKRRIKTYANFKYEKSKQNTIYTRYTFKNIFHYVYRTASWFTNMMQVQQIPIAADAAHLVLQRRRWRREQRHRMLWVRPWLEAARHFQHGHYHRLMPELRLDDFLEANVQ